MSRRDPLRRTGAFNEEPLSRRVPPLTWVLASLIAVAIIVAAVQRGRPSVGVTRLPAVNQGPLHAPN